MFSLRFIAFFRCIVIACLALASLTSPDAAAQTAPISRYARITGNVNFVMTGGSLRTSASNACTVGNSSSAPLSIPAGSSIRAAYLYWGGSGSTVDSSVTLNSSSVTASRTFTTTVPTPTRTFFGGFADITSRINVNTSSLTFGGLSVDNDDNYCSSATVVAGWGVVVIYSRASEPLRAINVFDGLESFFGSSVTLYPNGFRIPASGIDGKIAVITWDGDPANSDPSGGFSESLRFNGGLLDDGIIVPGSDPQTQQYDGTINSLNISNSYGVDIDTYNVTSRLSPGQTSATTIYSSGGDRVFLTAQIVSVTSEPSVDLSIAKTHSGNLMVGSSAAYTLTVSSDPGSQQTDFPIVVTDTLPAGLTYASATGTAWNCGASGQTVTCTHAGPLSAGASLPPIMLNVNVGNAAFPSVTNTAQVTTPSNDPEPANNSASDTATVLGSSLATSTKTVVDLNGGDANPGDTLRYTITLIETSGRAASGVAVTDDVPANVDNFTVATIPAGAANASTGAGTGANNNGFLNITGITVPANGTATITFDVRIRAGMPPGALIANTATVVNSAGAGAAPSSPDVIVSASSVPGSGTKQLYLRSDMGQGLSRTAPTSSQSAVAVTGSETWTLTPALQLPVTLGAGNMSLTLMASRLGTWLTNNRTISVIFSNSALGPLAQVNNLTLNNVPTSPSEYTVTLSLPTQITAPAGSTFSLTINYSSFLGLGISVWPYSGGQTSRLDLNSLSVIDVNSVNSYTAPYAGGASATQFNRGATVYVRSVVSDPFGSFDISGANVWILDPNGTTVINNVPMTQVADSGTSTRTYEYAFAVPSNAPMGAWTTRVIAREGTEGVTDLGQGSFTIVVPALSVQKVSAVLSDPVNGATNPKRIPGSVLRYTITVTNTGPGAIDAGTLIVTDPLPSDVELCVAAACGGVLAFVDGSPSSALSFTYASHTTFSSPMSGGAYTHTATPNAQGYDANISGLRIAPSGAMAGATGAGTPNFSVRFNVRVK